VLLARAAGALLCAAWLTACPRPPASTEPTPPPQPTPTPVPTPPPPPYVPNKRLETGKIFNGMQYRVTLETELGTTATAERNDPASYRAELVVKVKIPKPHQSLAEVARLNPELPKILPQLGALIESSAVSPIFDDLYRRKTTSLQNNLNRLDNLLTRHNFYDIETALELQHPPTQRRALFIQSEMDVDTDGSDIERVPVIEGASSTFQPFTSYRWPRTTDAVSPFSIFRETRLREVDQELAGNPPAARKETLKALQTDLKGQIGELKRFSFLVAQTDPFIVLPLSMFGKAKGPFSPGMGDYCLVIHGRQIMPAIVGDAGPTALMGEASLRICKQIYERANSAFRPENELKVTYLVFPGTADRPFAAPDLTKWNARCAQLLDEIGGHAGDFVKWADLIKPPAPPPPPTTPTPATPAPGATPKATPAAATPAAATPAPATPPR